VYDGVEDVYARPSALSEAARRTLFGQEAMTGRCG
jgi:hypothetical protein